MRLFDYCAECRRCCHIDPPDPPLEITLTAQEQYVHGTLCIERQCRYLARDGCTLGNKKPFSCDMYPLAYDPHTKRFFYDSECPLMPDYAAQLTDPASEATQHFIRIKTAVENSPPEFLEENFAVDVDYFDLGGPLPLDPRDSTRQGVVQAEIINLPPGGPGNGRLVAQRQPWTPKNLWVASDHNGIVYYTLRWNSLCPYIDVTEDMLEAAPKPLLVYGIPPESRFGVPVNDWYGLVDVTSPSLWHGDSRRQRKFAELDKLYRHFPIVTKVVPGASLTTATILELGSEHFARYYITRREVEAFVEYVRASNCVLIQVVSPAKEVVFSDLSILLPERNQVYGSFCQWNRGYKTRSPGLYACLLAMRWALANGYAYYNLGPMEDFGYKNLFVNTCEPIYGLALVPNVTHPLALDKTSPLYTDFHPEQWNVIER